VPNDLEPIALTTRFTAFDPRILELTHVSEVAVPVG